MNGVRKLREVLVTWEHLAHRIRSMYVFLAEYPCHSLRLRPQGGRIWPVKCPVPSSPKFEALLREEGLQLDQGREAYSWPSPANHHSPLYLDLLVQLQVGHECNLLTNWSEEERFLHEHLLYAPDAHSYKIVSVWELVEGSVYVTSRRASSDVAYAHTHAKHALSFFPDELDLQMRVRRVGSEEAPVTLESLTGRMQPVAAAMVMRPILQLVRRRRWMSIMLLARFFAGASNKSQMWFERRFSPLLPNYPSTSWAWDALGSVFRYDDNVAEAPVEALLSSDGLRNIAIALRSWSPKILESVGASASQASVC